MKILLDTSVWIEFFRGNKKLREKLEDIIKTSRIVITGPVISEILLGIRDDKEKRKVENLLKNLTIINPSWNDYVHAGEIGHSLRKNGKTIPLIDLIIAAVCIRNNITLFTLDKHFKEIKELKLLKL